MGKEQIIMMDDHFRSFSTAVDFFKRKDRSKSCETQEVLGIRSISWNQSGTLLGCGSDNRGISICNLDPHSCRIKQVSAFFEHDDVVEAVEFSKHDNMIMASCSSDKTLRIWDMRAPLKAHVCIPNKEANLYLAWTPDGRHIVVGDKSDTLSLVETRMNKVSESATFREEFNEFVCHPSGDYLFVTTDHGRLEILSLPTLKRVRSVHAHPLLSACQSIAISPNERYLAVGGTNAVTSLWDLRDLICVRTLNRLDYPVRSVSYSHCGNMIASGSEDRVIDVAWASTGEKVAEIPVQTECFDVAWHPCLYLLAYASGIDPASRDRDPISLRIFGYSGGGGGGP